MNKFDDVVQFSKDAIEWWDKIYKLRYTIAVTEQGIAETDEFDSTDTDKCIYFSGIIGEETIACCRVEDDVNTGEQNVARIERVAVDKRFRKKGFGRAIMKVAEAYIERSGKYNKITVNAQKQAVPFYECVGYKVVSDEKSVIGIPHYEMQKELRGNK